MTSKAQNTKVRPAQDTVNPAAPEMTNGVIDLAQFIARLEDMERKVGVAEEKASSAEARAEKLSEQLDSAQANGWYTDEFGNKVGILSSSMQQGNQQVHDKPGTIMEKLDIMEKMAKIRREPFDRERTRKILLGEPVEDFCKYRCEHCGRAEEAWNTNEDAFTDHVNHHLSQAGRKAAYPGRQKIRKVDSAVALAE